MYSKILYAGWGDMDFNSHMLAGWLDLDARKLIAPPPALLAAMNSLDKTDDFVQLPSSIKPRS